MIVYGIFYEDTDGFTYSCQHLHKVYAKLEDAVTELIRLELIYLEAKEYRKRSGKEYYEWFASLPDDDRGAAIYDKHIGFTFNIEDIEVL